MMPDPSCSPRRRFADRLRAARLARGFRTAKSFAQRLNIDQNTYTRYERAEAEPSIAMLDRIWTTLELPFCDLFGPTQDLARGAAEADTPRQPPSSPPVTLRESLGWRLADLFVDLTTRSGPGPSRLQRQGRLFLDLQTNPYPTLARLLAELPDHELPAPTVQRLDDAIRALTAVLDEEVRGLPRRPPEP
jgi:transcriptional regulator with XRE-family HTH domain